MLFTHGLIERDALVLLLWLWLGGGVINLTPEDFKPLQLFDLTDLKTLIRQLLLQTQNHFTFSMLEMELSFFCARCFNMAWPQASRKIFNLALVLFFDFKRLDARGVSRPFLGILNSGFNFRRRNFKGSTAGAYAILE